MWLRRLCLSILRRCLMRVECVCLGQRRFLHDAIWVYFLVGNRRKKTSNETKKDNTKAETL